MTAYGGELQYTVRFSPSLSARLIEGQPDVVLQGNGILLEHYSKTRPGPHVPQSISVTFREVRAVFPWWCGGLKLPLLPFSPVDRAPGGVQMDRRARGSTC